MSRRKGESEEEARERLNAQRRARYASDPVYRERKLAGKRRPLRTPSIPRNQRISEMKMFVRLGFGHAEIGEIFGVCRQQVGKTLKEAGGGNLPSPLEKAGKRFWDRVDQLSDGGCWHWEGKKTRGGYGRLKYEGKDAAAHRVAYELSVGPIPDGLQIDHLCHSRAVELGQCAGGSTCPHRGCVNPAHLEPVTPQENIQRGVRGNMTHCKRGHEFTPENTLKIKYGRSCRACKTDADRSRTKPRSNPDAPKGVHVNRTPGVSGFKGVRKAGSRWGAVISVGKGHQIWVGTFNTPEEAAQAYNDCAVVLHGLDAVLSELAA